MHPLLQRQLREHLGLDADERLPPMDASLAAFIEAVDRAYADGDVDRQVLERALNRSSEELLTADHEHRSALATATQLRQQLETRIVEVEGILAGAPHPILVTDADGTIQRVSSAVTTTLGWRPDDLVGASIATVLPEAEDYWAIRARRQAAYAKLMQDGAQPMRVTSEFAAKRADGSEVTVEGTLVDLVDPAGGYRIVVELADLSARRHAEAQARVLQKSEALATLVAGVAHDFNNILTMISGAFSAARADSPDHDYWIEVGQQSTNRAIALVASLLRFARRAPVTTASFDLAAMAQDVVRMLSEMLDRRIAFDAAIADDLPPVTGDQSELQQVLVNLVLNARDAVIDRIDDEDASYQPSIMISVMQVLAQGLPAVQVEVHDNGVGIAPDQLDRVFDPFFTTKAVGRGTGLGLSMAHSIVRAHGGEIRMESTVGVGTVASFWLPVDTPFALTAVAPAPEVQTPEAFDVSTDDAPPPAAGSLQPSTPPAVTWRLLVVDDEPNLLDLARLIFAEAQVATVEEPQRAIAEVEQATFDVALVDVSMPEMDGWELMERLRDLDPALPVIIMSGYVDPERVREHQPAAVVAKPYEARALADTVARVIAEHPRP